MTKKTSKNILYISYDGMTDPLGQSQVIPYLIGLTQKGLRFTILSCEKKENYLKNKYMISDLLKKNNIRWEPIFYTKKPPVLSTIYDYYKLRNKAQKLNKELHFAVIHCRSYISSLIGLWMIRKYKVPFIFDMRGFWADERVEGNLWNLNNPIFKQVYNFFKQKELEFLNEATAVVSLTYAGKNEILSWKGLNFTPEKITVIPCCVDTTLFDPNIVSVEDIQQLKKSLNIKNKDFIIGYLGSMGTWYMLDEMLQFFNELKNIVKNARLLFVTPNNGSEIQEKANLYNINTSDIIVTRANRTEVPLIISLFNYGLFFIKPSYSKQSSSPTKQGEIMAMGIPVICNAGIGDTDKIVYNYQSGLVIKNWDFKNTIEDILKTNTYNTQKIREGAINYFSLNNGVEKYNAIYKNILTRYYER